jgi:hypothetical protein
LSSHEGENGKVPPEFRSAEKFWNTGWKAIWAGRYMPTSGFPKFDLSFAPLMGTHWLIDTCWPLESFPSALAANELIAEQLEFIPSSALVTY